MTNGSPDETEPTVNDIIRRAYEGGETYKIDTVSSRPNDDAQNYSDRLLNEKIKTIRRHIQPGLMADLCCGNGEHMFALADMGVEQIGLDFSRPFITHAKAEAHNRKLDHLHFEVADARDLPLQDGVVGTLYSLSSLYAIPQMHQVLAEISRVLHPGGRCILDLANSQSLNSICVKAYYDLPPSFHISVDEMRRLCAENGLRIVEHRRFQLLPLWADKPRWMAPLLHPVWAKIMSRRVAGKMLDEWLSSAPILRRFAFRHLLVCEKC